MMIRAAFLVVGVLAAPAAPDPVLLEAISAREARIAALHEHCAFTATKRTETLDAKGTVTSWSETEERFAHKDGVLSRDVVRHVVDGKDRTKAMKREAAPADLKIVAPFSEKSRGDYRFTSLAADPETGWARIRFEPKRKDRADAASGAVDVDPATGAIRRMDYEPEHPGTLVQKMRVSLEYDAPSPEGPTVSHVRVVATGGILFVKKRMRVTVTFTDYDFPDDESEEHDGRPSRGK